MAAPSMKERQACWGARDEYWRCLDDNTEDASRCEKLRSSFEARCPQQWVRRARAVPARGARRVREAVEAARAARGGVSSGRSPVDAPLSGRQSAKRHLTLTDKIF
ncbi:Cytochrome c oxidase assembly factor 6 homolog [Vulpes lagopus]